MSSVKSFSSHHLSRWLLDAVKSPDWLCQASKPSFGIGDLNGIGVPGDLERSMGHGLGREALHKSNAALTSARNTETQEPSI